MARLAIRQLLYSGDQFEFSSPQIPDGVVVIEGENGTGKSTFSDLIYFCLGGMVSKFKRDGRAKHREITSDTNNYAELHVSIDDKHFKLKRFIGSNDVAVFTPTEVVDVFPILRSKDTKTTFSDWMLEQLGIDGFTLYFGRHKGKISFTDLLRLIYHDQAQDANKIYKALESENFVSDSTTFRKAIFEVLVGKSFSDYYAALEELTKIEQERTEIRGAIAAFASTMEKFGKIEDWNTVRIKEELTSIESQLNKLHSMREDLRKNQSVGDSSSVLSDLRREIENNQLEQTEVQDELNKTYSELGNLHLLKRNLILEVTHLRKIIFAHDQLSLFSPDTCPYCLSEVTRAQGKCICGTPVDESSYERFFYSTAEYLNILKSKQKNVDTVDRGITSCEEQVSELKARLSQLQTELTTYQSKISTAVANKTSAIDFSKLNQIDDRILELRSKEDTLFKHLDLESSRQEMEDKLAALESRHTSQNAAVDRLEASTREKMLQSISKFNEKYNSLVRDTVSNCRRARIDDSYMPLINDGEYLELSAVVPKRLMYFLTLLHLSLKDENINFPRFLLVDTPDTAGIDDDNLKKAISKIPETVTSGDEGRCQVILTTGLDMYPDSLKTKVLVSMTRANRLLKEKS